MKCFKFTAFLVFCAAPCAFASTVVSYDAPGVENTNIVGASIYSFNNLSPNRVILPATAFATFNQLYVIDANEYGGAAGSTYGVVGDPTGAANVQTALLQFARPVSYVGFWWSAADPNNIFTLYNGRDPVLTMTNQTLINALGSCRTPNAYCGNPNNGEDPGELFAYVNVWGTNGSTFTAAKFHQMNDRGGFEFDNVAYMDPPSDPPSGVPEPSTWGLAGLGFAAISMLTKRAHRA
jgi:hypothetical protein